jgi:DNA-directed RNA polymerase subunit RPC12/RpoP
MPREPIIGHVLRQRVEQNSDPPPRWKGFMEDVEALAVEFRAQHHDARDILARMRVALCPACGHRVFATERHHDGNGAGCPVSRPDRAWANRDDDIRLRCHKLGCKSGKALGASSAEKT